MAAQQDVFEMRLSRLPLFILFIFGAGFLFIGLELSVLHVLFPNFSVAPEKRIVFYVFLAFALGVGGLITVQMILYFLVPPVFYRVSAEGIAFPTGMRYNLYTIPWKHVASIGGGIDLAALAAEKKIVGGLQISFKESPEIPGMLATSIGARYIYYTLTLSYWYMNTSVKNAILKTAELQKKFGGMKV